MNNIEIGKGVAVLGLNIMYEKQNNNILQQDNAALLMD